MLSWEMDRGSLSRWPRLGSNGKGPLRGKSSHFAPLDIPPQGWLIDVCELVGECGETSVVDVWDGEGAAVPGTGIAGAEGNPVPGTAGAVEGIGATGGALGAVVVES